MESLTKTLNGHSDVILGFLGGRVDVWQRVATVISAWGLASGPFECWLADRGLLTAHLRIDRACQNALAAADFLSSQSPTVAEVCYPGLAGHRQHALARKQFSDRFGTMVSFRLQGGRTAADAFIAAAKRIPFCPSLGEVSTTLSHPETTSHRGMTAEQRAALGITGGTIRLSVGTESETYIREALMEALKAV
jgi:cystathionine beta-lyase/cystathionine gamma-synthase